MNEEIVGAISSEKKYETKKNVLILNKIVKWCIYIFIALMPLWFLPFTGNVLNLNKQVVMVALLTIALIAWLGKLLTQEKLEWYKGVIVLLFLAFVIVCVLSTFFSIWPYDSLMGSDTHLSRSLINVIYFFIFFILLINYREEEKSIKVFKFLTIFLVSSGIAGIIGLLQILGQFIFPWEFTKTTSFNTIGTVTSLGIFLAAILPLSLGLLLWTKRRKEKIKGEITDIWFKALLIGLIVLGLIVILLLNFRLIWILTAVGMLVIVGFLLNKRQGLSSRALGWLIIPTMILALCLIFFLFKPGFVFELSLPIEAGLSHKGGIDIAKTVIKDNPILGTGPETFIYNYSLHKPQSINQTIFWNFRLANASSEILTLFIETGILGLLAFLAIIGTFLFKIFKSLVSSGEDSDSTYRLKTGLLSGWLVLLVGWFLYPQNTVLLFVFWFLSALLIIITRGQNDIKVLDLKNSSKMALVISFGFIIAMMLIIGFLYLEGTKFLAEVKYKTGVNLINNGELDAGIGKVAKATVINSYEDKFYRNLSQFLLLQLNRDLNNPDLSPENQANKIQVGISDAINSAVRATNLEPKNVLNWINRGFVYRSLMNLINGAGDWAVSSYEKALELEPSNPFIHTEIAKTYLGKVNLTEDNAEKTEHLGKVIESYNNAIQLKPNYALPHFELALLFEQLGETEEAIARMEASKTLAPRDTGVAFQLGILYYKTSQFDKAKAEFVRAISLDSNFSNARYFLGLLFDREENKTAAIEQFERIAELNPDNELVEQILTNLRAGQPALGEGLGPPEQPEEVPME